MEKYSLFKQKKIVKGDKGNETVVIDKSDYKKKITEHMKDNNTYLPLVDYQIKTLQNKVNYELMKLKNQHKISDDQYKYIRCNKEVTPKILRNHKYS